VFLHFRSTIKERIHKTVAIIVRKNFRAEQTSHLANLNAQLIEKYTQKVDLRKPNQGNKFYRAFEPVGSRLSV